MRGKPYVRMPTRGGGLASDWEALSMAITQRKFGPKAADHPSVGETCDGCGRDFVPGDYTTLIPIGPGDSPDEQEKARNGQAYNAIAIEVHWTCATGEPA